MDRYEKQRIGIAKKIIKKWRKILKMDEIWNIRIEIMPCDDERMPLARVDIGNCEYFSATVEISQELIEQAPLDIYEEVLNEILSHELLHICLAPFSRYAQSLAGKNETSNRELRFLFEQSTTRLQKAFTDLEFKIREKENTIDNLRDYYFGERARNYEKIKALEDEIAKLKEQKPELAEKKTKAKTTKKVAQKKVKLL